MKERKVILTWEAICDLTDIIDYIECVFGRERADKFEFELMNQIEEIGYMGGSYGDTHIYYRSYSIFKKLFSPSVIFYIIKEPDNEIHVLRVLREERDWKKFFEDDRDYKYPNK